MGIVMQLALEQAKMQQHMGHSYLGPPLQARALPMSFTPACFHNAARSPSAGNFRIQRRIVTHGTSRECLHNFDSHVCSPCPSNRAATLGHHEQLGKNNMKTILPLLLALSVATGLVSQATAVANATRAPYAVAASDVDDPPFG